MRIKTTLAFAISIVAFMCCASGGPATDTNDIWAGTWKEGTNGLRVQLYWSEDTPGNPWLTVFVGSTAMSSGGLYFGPPSQKLAEFELKDSKGVLAPLKSGVEMVGQFASRLPLSDMPRYKAYSSWGSSAQGNLKHQLGFSSDGPPIPLKQFKLRDVCQISHEDDYTLTICAVIYKFETNMQYLDRIDLPCISTKIHLRP
jgi:hypothetical protein